LVNKYYCDGYLFMTDVIIFTLDQMFIVIPFNKMLLLFKKIMISKIIFNCLNFD